MVVMGINTGHGASAALMINGVVTRVFLEERSTKIKNFHGYPLNSIKNCIDYCIKENLKIDIAAFSSFLYNSFALKYPFQNYFTVSDYKKFYGEEYYDKIFSNKSVKEYLSKLRKDKRIKSKYYLKYRWEELNLQGDNEVIRSYFSYYLKKNSKNIIKKITFLDHHSCHAYYAFYSIDKNEIKKNKVAIITLDSLGDNLNQTLWISAKNREKLININKNNECDLARIYKFVTLILSMKPNEHEFKVMGLAPYAKKAFAIEVYNEVFKDLLKVKNCKIVYHNRPQNLYKHLKDKLENYRFDNIAGGLQLFIEKITSKLIKQISKKHKVKHFAISGGVSMNVKLHKVLSELKCVKKIYVAPTGSDDSLSIGACYLLEKNNSKPLKNIYLGSELFENKNNIKNIIKKKIRKFKNISFIDNMNPKGIANLLKKGEIIALAQGREEFGARALGNRSIIANPSKDNLIKTLNEMIKNRDFWMPFSLTLLSEKSQNYIINPKNLKCDFMTIAFDTTKKNYKYIKSGTHQYDKTVRPQILDREKNENFYKIIKNFYKKTNIPAVINTSLNIHGYPISSSFDDVFNTFLKSGLKYLFIENKFLLKKND